MRQVTPPDQFSYARAQHRVNPAELSPCLRALAALERSGEVVREKQQAKSSARTLFFPRFLFSSLSWLLQSDISAVS